jgi:uncharacterized protein (DUF488 family)
MAIRHIFTIGYGGRHPQDFLDLLRSHQVGRIIDVRVRPDRAVMGAYVKARSPERGIAHLLSSGGIGYAHFLELGNIFLDRDDWQQPYRALLDSAGVLLLERLRRIDEPLCLLCAEKDVTRCHRGIIAAKLAEEGYRVTHL